MWVVVSCHWVVVCSNVLFFKVVFYRVFYYIAKWFKLFVYRHCLKLYCLICLDVEALGLHFCLRSVSTAFKCFISSCNNVVVETIFCARLTKFVIVLILNLSGRCSFHLIYQSIYVSFLWAHTSTCSLTLCSLGEGLVGPQAWIFLITF